MLKKIDLLLQRICEWVLIIDGILIVIMGFFVTYLVLGRYLFHAPTAVPYEMVMMLMVLTCILAIPSVERYRRNIRMTLFVDIIPDSFRNILTNIISPVLGLFYCYILVSKGFVEAFYSVSVLETTGSSWDVPIYWLKMIIPIAYCLLLIVLVSELIDGFIKIKMRMFGNIQNNKEQAVTRSN